MKRFASFLADIFAEQLFVARLLDLGGHLGRQAFVGAVLDQVHQAAGQEQDAHGPITLGREVDRRQPQRQAEHEIGGTDRGGVEHDVGLIGVHWSSPLVR
jgi:hypothetical protein